jgi:hypothetical protein
MCIKEGDIVFFNVQRDALNYPTYLKNSLLNNNMEFDYADFTKLEEMINAGVDVTTFSFIFQQKGIYVFTNKGSGTLMTFTVVAPAEECEGSSGGVGVSMITEEALSSFGVQAQEKGI